MKAEFFRSLWNITSPVEVMTALGVAQMITTWPAFRMSPALQHSANSSLSSWGVLEDEHSSSVKLT